MSIMTDVIISFSPTQRSNESIRWPGTLFHREWNIYQYDLSQAMGAYLSFICPEYYTVSYTEGVMKYKNKPEECVLLT